MSNKEIRMQKKNLLFTVLVIYSLLDRYVSKSRMYKRSLIAAINLLRRILDIAIIKQQIGTSNL